MQSHAEYTGTKREQRRRDAFSVWNRKSHYYIGLYFIFFLWLFAFTGLLLNHSWSFAEFWPNRKVSKFEKPVKILPYSNELERARELMKQLGIRGEVEWTAARVDSAAFSFRVGRPGKNWQVTLDDGSDRVAVEQTEVNGWGLIRVLHTFTGVRAGDQRNERDWILTTVWALAMDAVAVGLILMVFTGLYLWVRLPAKRLPGGVAFVAGSIACGLFVFGLRLLY
jgi:hypothetical protein